VTETAWFRSFFSGAYLDVQRATWTAADTTRHVDLLSRALALAPGSRIIDAPCGNGRLALPLARAGHDVVGIDITASYLDEARAVAARDGLRATFLHRDMRELADLSGFDAVINFWGSFGYFDDAGNAAFVAAAYAALRPGGKLVLDGHVHETLLPRFQRRGWSQHGDVLVLEDRRFDVAGSRIESDWTLIATGGGGEAQRGIERKHISMRLYSGAELIALLRAAGFAAVELFDHDLAPLALGAGRALAVAIR
jgi:SAM-dependent methyltransferase